MWEEESGLGMRLNHAHFYRRERSLRWVDISNMETINRKACKRASGGEGLLVCDGLQARTFEG